MKRYEWLLSLLYSPGVTEEVNKPVEGRIRLMKGLFLVGQELGEGFYRFEPYLFTSFEAHRDLKLLSERRLVSDEDLSGSQERRYRLTPKGIEHIRPAFNTLPQETRERLRGVKRLINRSSNSDLLRCLYAKYPDYAHRPPGIDRPLTLRGTGSRR